jgi:hypothetical protein
MKSAPYIAVCTTSDLKNWLQISSSILTFTNIAVATRCKKLKNPKKLPVCPDCFAQIFRTRREQEAKPQFDRNLVCCLIQIGVRIIYSMSTIINNYISIALDFASRNHHQRRGALVRLADLLLRKQTSFSIILCSRHATSLLLDF